MSGSISASTLAVAATVASGAVGAYGAISAGEAQSSAAKYQSQVAANNAIVAQQNASWAAQAGNAQAEQKQLQTRAKVGGIQAEQASKGIDVNSGSAVDVKSSASELGELDAINIRSNAARTAYGYNNQATSYQNQSQLDQFEANNDESSGFLKAGSTLLGAAGSAYSNWSGGNGLSGGLTQGGYGVGQQVYTSPIGPTN